MRYATKNVAYLIATKIVAMESRPMVQKNDRVKIPRLGDAVRGSKTGQPIMVLFDLIGRRWAMGILWNLSDQDCTFRELQARCASLSPTVPSTTTRSPIVTPWAQLRSRLSGGPSKREFRQLLLLVGLLP